MAQNSAIDDLKYDCADSRLFGPAKPDQLKEDDIQKGWTYFDNTCKVAGMKRALTNAYDKEFSKLIRTGQLKFDALDAFKDLSLPDISQYMLITVNAHDGCSLMNLRKAVDKYTKRAAIRAAMWCFEQRASTEAEMGKGPHCHLLVEQYFRSKREFHTQTESTFKNVCDLNNSAKYQILNRRICKLADLSKRANYIRGIKKDHDKCIKVEVDKVWRERNHLQPCYYKGDLNFQWSFDAGLSSEDDEETELAQTRGGRASSDSEPNDDMSQPDSIEMSDTDLPPGHR